MGGESSIWGRGGEGIKVRFGLGVGGGDEIFVLVVRGMSKSGQVGGGIISGVHSLQKQWEYHQKK